METLPTLIQPYRYTTRLSHPQSLSTIVKQWLASVAFWQEKSRVIPALYAVYHLITFSAFISFFTLYFSWNGYFILIACAIITGIFYNSIWYHRYCSHRAFEFRHIGCTKFFLWTNPIGFREENYVIPHRVHHAYSDDDQKDPYGPHLGWLGNYLATAQQNINPQISKTSYEALVESLKHIGFIAHSYAQFQRTASVENIWHFSARTLVAQSLWLLSAYWIAEWEGVVIWLSAIFLHTFMVRNFNYYTHGGSLFKPKARKGAPENLLIYGMTVAEWHKNHHRYPHLAQQGFKWWQLDSSYRIIQLLSLAGFISRYNACKKKI